MRRFVLLPPGDARPSLLVDVVERADAAALGALREGMLQAGCGNGLVVDAGNVHILHDTYGSMTEDSIVDEAQIDTERLLGSIPSDAPLAVRVERWLERLSAHWSETLPHETWIKPLLTDVVPAASGSIVRSFEPAA